MAAKTPLQKAIEKQQKAVEKQQKEQTRIARQNEIRERANAVVSAAKYVNTFRVMDLESETLFAEILNQYDGNSNNYVNFNVDPLPRHIAESISVGYEKLLLYGVLASVNAYITGAMLTLSESGKRYFEDKQNAIEQQVEDGDIVRIARKQYDVFISHANKDKEDYVDLLNASVKRLGINIFYDTDVLSWGDNWKQMILEGTQKSEFAIIVISRNFFGREWTERELAELLARQNENKQKIVLPLLHGISLDELKEKYPELGDIQCISSDDYSREEIVLFLAKELIKRYR